MTQNEPDRGEKWRAKNKVGIAGRSGQSRTMWTQQDKVDQIVKAGQSRTKWTKQVKVHKAGQSGQSRVKCTAGQCGQSSTQSIEQNNVYNAGHSGQSATELDRPDHSGQSWPQWTKQKHDTVDKLNEVGQVTPYGTRVIKWK